MRAYFTCVGIRYEALYQACRVAIGAPRPGTVEALPHASALPAMADGRVLFDCPASYVTDSPLRQAMDAAIRANHLQSLTEAQYTAILWELFPPPTPPA